jgi:hypothetical protein
MGLNYNPTIVPDGLVMYFDPANSRSSVGSGNTIYDLSGNSNTCTFSATPTYDVASKGNLLLAGYGTVPHTSTLWGSNQFTLSVWAKRTSGTSGIMISKDTNYIDHQYGGVTLASFYATAAYSPRQYLVSGISTSINNEWRHYTSTYDGTTGSLYENGALIGTINMSVEILKSTDPFNIGRWNGGGYDFSGHLGTIMTYNRALSAQEVKQNYDATKGRYISPENIVTNGLILNIDPANSSSYSGIGNTIYDLSGFGNTGTLTNGPTFSALNGGSIVFDGSNDFLGAASSSSLDISTNLSAVVWMKLITTDGANHIIFSKTSSTNPFLSNYEAYLKNDVIYWWDSPTERNTTVTLSINSWTQVVFVRSSTSLLIYKNGTLSNTISVNQVGPIVGDFYIGKDPNGQFLNFNLAQFLLYNRALSATEIMQNYNATKGRFGL